MKVLKLTVVLKNSQLNYLGNIFGGPRLAHSLIIPTEIYCYFMNCMMLLLGILQNPKQLKNDLSTRYSCHVCDVQCQTTCRLLKCGFALSAPLSSVTSPSTHREHRETTERFLFLLHTLKNRLLFPVFNAGCSSDLNIHETLVIWQICAAS